MIDPDSTLVFAAADVDTLLEDDVCIEAVESAFRLHAEGRSQPPVTLAVAGRQGGFHVKAAGLEIAGQVPMRLTTGDVEAAVRVVTFGSVLEGYAGDPAIEVWEDVPPVSEDYGKARDRIVERVERLLDELAHPAREAAGGLAP